MKVMVTGAKGQLGSELVALFADHEVTGVDIDEMDLTVRADVQSVVQAASPEVIVHGAAYTAVDACESNEDLAYAVNCMGTRFIQEAARRVGARVVYVSTDYVFDGTKETAYHEWDDPNPQSVYGRSKLGGERELDGDATVARTAWVCGRYGQNMVKTILRLSDEHETLSFVDDQRGHPTIVSDLARQLHTLVIEELTGLYHVTNQGAVSWYEFARAVLKADGQDPDRVQPIATADLKPARPAPRPANSVLDNRALRLAGIELAPDFRESLATLVAQIRADAASEG